jgi:hypothetical protein
MNPKSTEELEKWKLETREKEYQELIQILERYLDFRRWGFQTSYHLISSEFLPSVTYDSEWCRVKFSLRGGDMYRGHEMSVRYGRLHAPNNEAVMIWKGEKCFCWHDEYDALCYLDGLSPQEALDQIQIKGEWPHVVEQFRCSKIGKELSREHHPEYVTRMQAVIWEHYGKLLFELFDLRQPNLWEKYALYIREYHRIKESKLMPGYPPPWQIC